MHMVSVLLSEMIKPNVPKTSTKTAIIRPSPRGDRDTMHASSAYNIPQIARRTDSSAVSGPTFDDCSCWWIRSASMPASLLNLYSATRSIAAKNTLNSSGESTHLWRSPCPTSNHLEHHRTSSFRTHALIPLWNWRITSIICGGTSKRATTCRRSVRLTGSYAFCRSMKHRNRTVARALSFPTLVAFGPRTSYLSSNGVGGTRTALSAASSSPRSRRALRLVATILRRAFYPRVTRVRCRDSYRTRSCPSRAKRLSRHLAIAAVLPVGATPAGCACIVVVHVPLFSVFFWV